jgi:transcriptional regulator with XRE-family HTH domain
MPMRLNGPQGDTYTRELTEARKRKHGTLAAFEINTGGNYVSYKTLSRYENGEVPRRNRNKLEKLHEHYDDVKGKDYLNNLLDKAVQEVQDHGAEGQPQIVASPIGPFMESPEGGEEAKREYDRLVSKGLRSSSRCVVVARSAMEWIRTRASALGARFERGESETTFVLSGPHEYLPKDESAALASTLIDKTERGDSPGSHCDRVKTALNDLELNGAHNDVVKVYFHPYIPPFTAAVFDQYVLLEPKYLSPIRKPGSQVPFMVIDREDNEQFYNYIWADVQEVIKAAEDPNALWPQGLVRPVKWEGWSFDANL